MMARVRTIQVRRAIQPTRADRPKMQPLWAVIRNNNIVLVEERDGDKVGEEED
jgi:hypothetical protein